MKPTEPPDSPAVRRYRELFAHFRDDASARERLANSLQVLALTDPAALREVEAFVDRLTSRKKASDKSGEGGAEC